MDFKEALDALVEEIKALVQRLIDRAPFDKTYTGVVVAAATMNNNFTATVRVNGKNYNVKSDHMDPVNTYVRVKVPRNDWTQAYITNNPKGHMTTMGTLPSSDLNDAQAVGMYILDGNSTYTNMPSDVSFGILEVVRGGQTGNFISQVVYPAYRTESQSSIRQRIRVNNIWSDWYTLLQSVKADDATTASYDFAGITGTLNLTKRYKTITMEIKIAGTPTSASVTGTNNIATIPAGWRPINQITVSGVARNNGAWASATYYPCSVIVATSGVVQLCGNQTNMRACTNWTAQCVWNIS